MRARIAAVLLAFLARVILRTLRVEIPGGLAVWEGPPRIYAFFHGRQFALLRLPRPRGMAAMVSLSRDGEIQAGLLKHLGLEVVRGSSSRRGSTGIRELVRRVRAGLDAAVAVDGPRGPRGEVQLGVLAIARWTGAQVIPITFAATRAWVFHRAWDHYVLPWPFAKVVIISAPPISIGRAATAADLALARQALGQALAALAESAQALLDDPDGRVG